MVNPLNAELNPISFLLALLEAHHILHVSRIRVKGTNFLGGVQRQSVVSGTCSWLVITFSYSKSNYIHWFLKFVFGIKLYIFSDSSTVHHQEFFTVHTAMVYVIQLASRIRTERNDPARKLSANLYDIYHCCVYSEKLLMMDWWNCPKHVEFYSKNKFEKLVYLVGFIIRNGWGVQMTICCLDWIRIHPGQQAFI